MTEVNSTNEVVGAENINEVVKESNNDIVMLRERTSTLQETVRHQEEEIKELKTLVDGAVKDLHSLSTTLGLGFVLMLVTVAGLVFSIYSTNNNLLEHANAINNNSYSIESIIDSIKAE